MKVVENEDEFLIPTIDYVHELVAAVEKLLEERPVNNFYKRVILTTALDKLNVGMTLDVLEASFKNK